MKILIKSWPLALSSLLLVSSFLLLLWLIFFPLKHEKLALTISSQESFNYKVLDEFQHKLTALNGVGENWCSAQAPFQMHDLLVAGSVREEDDRKVASANTHTINYKHKTLPIKVLRPRVGSNVLSKNYLLRSDFDTGLVRPSVDLGDRLMLRLSSLLFESRGGLTVTPNKAFWHVLGDQEGEWGAMIKELDLKNLPITLEYNLYF